MTAIGAPGVLRTSRRQRHLRRVRRLRQGLIAYGVVGLVVAAIGFGAMVWVNGQIGTLRTDAEATVVQAATTMELTASALRGASTTAQSFGRTADQTSQAVSAASVTISEVRSDLSSLEAQLRSVSLLGATPLASSADAVGRIAAGLDALNTQIPLVTDSLTGNRDALAGNAAALGALADSTAALAARLAPGTGPDPFGDLQQVIALTLLMVAAWTFAPAVGALALAAWLRGEFPEPSLT